MGHIAYMSGAVRVASEFQPLVRTTSPYISDFDSLTVSNSTELQISQKQNAKTLQMELFVKNHPETNFRNLHIVWSSCFAE